MTATIRTMSAAENDLWLRLGHDCNADRPEFQPGNVAFPPLEDLEPGENVVRLVAESGRDPVGRALAVTSSRGSVRLFEISVLPAVRRQGIGTRLLREAEAVARDAGSEFMGTPYYLDEAGFVREFFRACGYFEKEHYSVMIDLTVTPPKEAREKVERLRGGGMRLRQVADSDEDLDLLGTLQERYFPGWPEGMLPPPWDSRLAVRKNLAHDTAAAFFAEKEGQIAGFVMGNVGCTTIDTRFARKAGEGLLSSIAVTEDFRRQGVGTFVCMGLMDACREHGDRVMCYGGVRPGHMSMKLAQGVGGEVIRKHYSIARRPR